jgi:hypothetical protein
LAAAGLALAGCVPAAVTEDPTAEAPPLGPTQELPTVVASATPVTQESVPPVSAAVFEDEINDPIDCVTGQPSTGVMVGYMDIHAIRLEVRQADVTWVWIVAPGSDLPALFASNPLAGGLGFVDPARPMPSDPDWYFNNVANSGFGFLRNRDTRVLDGYDSLYTADGWTTVEGFTTSVVVAGNEIRVTLPWEQIPAGAAWYGSTTNGVVCDQIGLVDDLPTLDGPQAGSSGEIY